MITVKAVRQKFHKKLKNKYSGLVKKISHQQYLTIWVKAFVLVNTTVNMCNTDRH